MIPNSLARAMCAALFLTGAGTIGTAGAEESHASNNGSSAPEATAAELNIPFRDIPVMETAFIDTAPALRADGIPVAELSIDADQKAAIIKLAEEIGAGQHGRYDSMLIAHDGDLVFESYFRRGRINLAHPQASATKGHTSLILGRAMQLGYLSMADLNKPIIDFLDDLDRSKLVPGADKTPSIRR